MVLNHECYKMHIIGYFVKIEVTLDNGKKGAVIIMERFRDPLSPSAKSITLNRLVG